MSTILQILAKSTPPPVLGPDGMPLQQGSEPPPESFFWDIPIDDIWRFIDSLNWLHAVMILATGIIYLIYGWRLFRALITMNFAIGGLIIGMLIGRKLGSPLWGGIIGTIIIGVVSYPFMKYAVSVLGGLAGAVLGAALWRTVTLPDNLIWCGALAGLVAGGFLAFSSLRASIMVFSSLQGAVCIVVGVLALLSDYPELGQHVAGAVYSKAFLLPLMLLVPTAMGIFFQQKLLKVENKWEMPER